MCRPLVAPLEDGPRAPVQARSLDVNSSTDSRFERSATCGARESADHLVQVLKHKYEQLLKQKVRPGLPVRRLPLAPETRACRRRRAPHAAMFYGGVRPRALA